MGEKKGEFDREVLSYFGGEFGRSPELRGDKFADQMKMKFVVSLHRIARAAVFKHGRVDREVKRPGISVETFEVRNESGLRQIFPPEFALRMVER